MKSEKYNIEFYPMTKHLEGIQSPDEYIKTLIDYLYGELFDRRIDKENSIKILKETIKKFEEN
jgi:hypothetical protein